MRLPLRIILTSAYRGLKHHFAARHRHRFIPRRALLRARRHAALTHAHAHSISCRAPRGCLARTRTGLAGGARRDSRAAHRRAPRCQHTAYRAASSTLSTSSANERIRWQNSDGLATTSNTRLRMRYREQAFRARKAYCGRDAWVRLAPLSAACYRFAVCVLKHKRVESFIASCVTKHLAARTLRIKHTLPYSARLLNAPAALACGRTQLATPLSRRTCLQRMDGAHPSPLLHDALPPPSPLPITSYLPPLPPTMYLLYPWAFWTGTGA